ncbi:MAG: hypothetical protein VCD66_03945, partial [Alphaproteobacteria bacterium]
GDPDPSLYSSVYCVALDPRFREDDDLPDFRFQRAISSPSHLSRLRNRDSNRQKIALAGRTTIMYR